MFKYANNDLAELAHQLTLSPVRQRVRQLDGIDDLLEMVEPDRAYPYDLICYHITGYRKRRGDTAKPAIVGDKLIRDLVTMAEHLSGKAKLPASGIPGLLRTLEETAEYLNVSAKTVRRWRNRGLMSIRVRCEGGSARVMFRQKTIKRFVFRNKELVRRGAAFRQLTDAEKRDIVDRARRMLDRERIKLHLVAKAVAEETGRAVETVRYTLRRHDHENPDRALFANGGQPRLSERHLAIWKCHQAGEPAAQIASALGLSVASVEQVIREVEARQLAAAPPSYVHNELFDAPNADELILHVEPPAPTEAKKIKPPRDLPPYLRSLYDTPLLTAKQEKDLFRRYNYVKYKAAKAIEAMDVCTVSADELESIRSLTREYEDLRQRIVQSNLRLVVSIAKKHVGWSPNFQEVVSDGNMSLMRAVEKFDFARGFKFSTYGTWAIVKNYARTIPESHYHFRRYVTGQDELLEAATAAHDDPAVDCDSDQVRTMLAESMKGLTERERVVVTNHYGLFGSDPPQTLEELGRRFGVTKERVRQIEKKALDKIRSVLSPAAADLLTG
ncbi:MAG: sigma-70 family RNA polymerase sigma factor [Phycisphaerales bacterium]|nr:MAG: sigma-70 family RNA polymerase sigma factor [Phycisphaerales bacterium]